MTQPDKAHLRLVDVHTGEICDVPGGECGDPACAAMRSRMLELIEEVEALRGAEHRLEDAENDLRHHRSVERLLRKQLTEDLQGYERHDVVDRTHTLWQKLCRHPNSPLDNDRADNIRKILMIKVKGKLVFTELHCRLAVLGAAAAPYVTNGGGGKKRHDSIGLIFRNAEKFEDFANRGAMWLTKHPDYRPMIMEGLDDNGNAVH